MRILREATSPRKVSRTCGKPSRPVHSDTEFEREVHMTARKLREVAAALFALTLVVILLAVAAAVFGYRIPGLVNITDALGIGT